ncbi:hypothetical protein [Tautonia plasticadhaerens]|uniref:Uncharacterized protein n=1 Tax=Tautonia plasticadhaerens TaxID=2527974 RepID=A0A518H2E2_9BACT|nr:hypothetical protein [Tautonia plasticadhaerens]QDV34987.1 hypothetical protein ElP_28840 [Tautonia plasticadhaerens]
MSNAVELTKERIVRQTDADCVFTDGYGVRWFKYEFKYPHRRPEGSLADFAFDIWATSDQDAAERLASIKASAKIQGRIVTGIDT